MIQWSDFFRILSVDKEAEKYTISIDFNPEHEIFKGHFPGNPVVPGVCMVQIIKDILKQIFQRDFIMKQASQLKFLAVINPNDIKTIQVDLTILKNDASGINVSGSFSKGERIFLKYKATFIA